MENVEDEMGSKRKPGDPDLPDPTAQISARLRGSIVTKLDAAVAERRRRAREDGKPEEIVEKINRAFVLNSVLPGPIDKELVSLGLDPADDDKLTELAASIDLEKKKPRVSKDIDARSIAVDGTTRKHVAGH